MPVLGTVFPFSIGSTSGGSAGCSVGSGTSSGAGAVVGFAGVDSPFGVDDAGVAGVLDSSPSLPGFVVVVLGRDGDSGMSVRGV